MTIHEQYSLGYEFWRKSDPHHIVKAENISSNCTISVPM